LLTTVAMSPTALVWGKAGAWIWIALVTLLVIVPRVALADRLALLAYLLFFLIAGHAEPEHRQAYWGFVILPLQIGTLCRWSTDWMVRR
jgi:hypothetical protein